MGTKRSAKIKEALQPTHESVAPEMVSRGGFAQDDGAWRSDERHRVMAEALDRFALWDHLPVELRKSAVAEVVTGCYPLDFDLLYEQVEFDADGENLAEGGVERFLASLAPALVRHGVMSEPAVRKPLVPGLLRCWTDVLP